MKRQVDVAVIGAGHAGLNAIKEVRKVTENYVLINGGQLGTTCARIGCMPSKVALHLGETRSNGAHWSRAWHRGWGDHQGRHCQGHGAYPGLARSVRRSDPRQHHGRHGRQTHRRLTAELVDRVPSGSETDHPHWSHGDSDRGVLVHTAGVARLRGRHPNCRDLIRAGTLPESIAVLGLGPMGIELAQALHGLGVRVVGVERGDIIARIDDPVVNSMAIEIMARGFPLWLGADVRVDRQGDGFRVSSGERETQVDKLLVAVGRHPNLRGMGLERLGVTTNHQGVPEHHPHTMQVGSLPIYIAGDAGGGLSTLQRAADQGRIAGHNAARGGATAFKPKTNMSIVFCNPNVASVGASWSDLDPEATAVGQVRFGPVGRAVIAGRNRGVLRLYADKRSGQILGAAMVGAECEHLAHLVAWAVEAGMTVTEALRMPYYHPVYEEAIQDALYDLDRHLNGTDSSMVQFKRLGPVAAVGVHGRRFLAPLHSVRAWGRRNFLGG